MKRDKPSEAIAPLKEDIRTARQKTALQYRLGTLFGQIGWPPARPWGMLGWPRLEPSQGEMRAWVIPLCRVLMMKKILGVLLVSLALMGSASGGDWCCGGCCQHCYSLDPGCTGGCSSGCCNGNWKWNTGGLLPCRFFKWCRCDSDPMSSPWYTIWPSNSVEFSQGPTPTAFPYWPSAITASMTPQSQPAYSYNFGGPFRPASQQVGYFQPPSYWYGR